MYIESFSQKKSAVLLKGALDVEYSKFCIKDSILSDSIKILAEYSIPFRGGSRKNCVRIRVLEKEGRMLICRENCRDKLEKSFNSEETSNFKSLINNVGSNFYTIYNNNTSYFTESFFLYKKGKIFSHIRGMEDYNSLSESDKAKLKPNYELYRFVMDKAKERCSPIIVPCK